jgi:hypothetical protein
MRLDLSLDLPALLLDELDEAANACHLTARQFVEESVHSVLASRRLPRIEPGRCGAAMCGTKGHEDEDTASESAVCEHTILMPEVEAL